MKSLVCLLALGAAVPTFLGMTADEAPLPMPLSAHTASMCESYARIAGLAWESNRRGNSEGHIADRATAGVTDPFVELKTRAAVRIGVESLIRMQAEFVAGERCRTGSLR